MSHSKEKISEKELTLHMKHSIKDRQSHLQAIHCSFSLPPLQSRLENLMGTNVVHLTDRNYMLSLRRKIQEEYEDTVRKRIQSRERAEIDRQKKLILDGKMPFSDAPAELTNHPVFKITQITHQMLDERKFKSKRTRRPVHPASTSDKPSSGRGARCDPVPSVSPGREPRQDDGDGRPVVVETGRDVEDSEFVFTQEQFDKLRYETEAVKYLRGLETVDEIYEVASRIVGELQLHNVQPVEIVGCTTLGINLH